MPSDSRPRIPETIITVRLWRARRRHDHLDAELHTLGSGVELRYLRNDRVFLVWRYDDRDVATADAASRLASLQRAGWTVHW